ncbi:hypothetical protein [Novipirellula caenicola]|uniref:Uncharacterized protein n=1 Tax=Novipirellula caenicola TaxID=1536901 RepID=A0ABP9VQ81_9BACT
MPRFSIRDVLYFLTGFAALFAFIALGGNKEQSILGFFVDSLGLLYGPALLCSGYIAFFLCCKVVRRTCSVGDVAACLPIALLPTLIGAFGMIHAFIYHNFVFGSQSSYPNPSNLLYAHSVALVCMATGMAASAPSYILLSCVLVRQVLHRDR